MVGHQLTVIVDVSVQRGDHARGLRGPRLHLVDGMGIGLIDQADARPPGVAQHGDPGLLGLERTAQQVVGLDRRAQLTHVVAELADLARHLVDEAEMTVRRGDGAAAQQRIAALLELRGDIGLAQVEPVAGDQQLESGGVPSADLEPVERRDGDLHRGEGFDRRGARAIRADHLGYGPGVGDPLHPDCPDRVLDLQQPGVDRLDRVAHQRYGAGVDPPLELLDPALEALGAVLEIVGELGMLEHGLQTGDPPEGLIDGQQIQQRVLEAVGERSAGLVGPQGGRDTALHAGDEVSWVGRRSIRRPAKHSNDSAHDFLEPRGASAQSTARSPGCQLTDNP